MRAERTLHAAAGACSALAALSADAAVIQTLTTVSLPGGSTRTVGNLGANPAPNNDNATAARCGCAGPGRPAPHMMRGRRPDPR